MIKAQYINLNMITSGVMPVLYCSQYDVGRPLGMVVYNGSEAVDLSTYAVTIEGTRTDGTPITAAVTTDENIAAFETTATMTNVPDFYKAQLVITDGSGKRVASIRFMMKVNEAAMNENSEGIQEDASLYQQYTGTVQTLISAVRADLLAEANRAQAAEAAEASARASADASLQSAIASEASTRAAADQNLQAQVNQIIAPSGEAPSAAEVQNARIGADNVTYPTLGDAIRGQVTDLKNHINQLEAMDGIVPISGGDGSFSDSTFSAIKTGDVIALNGTYTASTRRRFKLSGDFAVSTATPSSWYADAVAALPESKPFAAEAIELGGSVTIPDENYAANLLVYNTSGDIIMSAYLYASGWRKSVINTSATNIGAVTLTVNKNYAFNNYALSYRIIQEMISGDLGFVDGASGNDTQIGSKTSPIKSINKALQVGYRRLCVKPGLYNEKIALTGGNFELIPWIDGQAYNGAASPYRPKIKLIKGTKLTVSASGSTGIYQASYTATSGSNIYKVFVDQSLTPTTSGSLALEYNALLVGDMPDTSTASKAFSPYRQRLFTPVLTEEELSAEGAFFYDDTNHLIKFHPWNDTADGDYYIPDDDVDNLIYLQNMDSVHLEDVKAIGAYYSCIYITHSDDVTLNACEAGYSAKSMGIKLDYANARASDCHAYAISVDGFNLHGYGYSEIVGCTAFYCGDDGISHHEGCSGFIDGGEWAYCGSGGITPSFGSQIDVRNAYAHHNKIGIQWLGLATQSRYTKMCNCLSVDNTNSDIYVKWYVVEAWNNIFRTKDSQYSSARSKLIEYGTITPE